MVVKAKRRASREEGREEERVQERREKGGKKEKEAHLNPEKARTESKACARGIVVIKCCIPSSKVDLSAEGSVSKKWRREGEAERTSVRVLRRLVHVFLVQQVRKVDKQGEALRAGRYQPISTTVKRGKKSAPGCTCTTASSTPLRGIRSLVLLPSFPA